MLVVAKQKDGVRCGEEREVRTSGVSTVCLLEVKPLAWPRAVAANRMRLLWLSDFAVAAEAGIRLPGRAAQPVSNEHGMAGASL